MAGVASAKSRIFQYAILAKQDSGLMKTSPTACSSSAIDFPFSLSLFSGGGGSLLKPVNICTDRGGIFPRAVFGPGCAWEVHIRITAAGFPFPHCRGSDFSRGRRRIPGPFCQKSGSPAVLFDKCPHHRWSGNFSLQWTFPVCPSAAGRWKGPGPATSGCS